MRFLTYRRRVILKRIKIFKTKNLKTDFKTRVSNNRSRKTLKFWHYKIKSSFKGKKVAFKQKKQKTTILNIKTKNVIKSIRKMLLRRRRWKLVLKKKLATQKVTSKTLKNKAKLIIRPTILQKKLLKKKIIQKGNQIIKIRKTIKPIKLLLKPIKIKAATVAIKSRQRQGNKPLKIKTKLKIELARPKKKHAPQHLNLGSKQRFSSSIETKTRIKSRPKIQIIKPKIKPELHTLRFSKPKLRSKSSNLRPKLQTRHKIKTQNLPDLRPSFKRYLWNIKINDYKMRIQKSKKTRFIRMISPKFILYLFFKENSFYHYLHIFKQNMVLF